MKVEVTRRFEIDGAHRLPDHEGKCKHLHGHRWIFEVTVEGEPDAMGRVVDFSELKRVVGGWLDDHWDHATIVWAQDKELLRWLEDNDQRCDIMDEPPTIENMVKELAAALYCSSPEACHSPEPMTEIVQIVGYETPNCSATWSR